ATHSLAIPPRRHALRTHPQHAGASPTPPRRSVRRNADRATGLRRDVRCNIGMRGVLRFSPAFVLSEAFDVRRGSRRDNRRPTPPADRSGCWGRMSGGARSAVPFAGSASHRYTLRTNNPPATPDGGTSSKRPPQAPHRTVPHKARIPEPRYPAVTPQAQ